MAIWLIRAGEHGEYEEKFLTEKRVYLTWNDLNRDISKVPTQSDLLGLLTTIYPDAKPNRLRNHAGQIYRFAKEIQVGDLVILPLKTQRVICVGEIASDYHFDAKQPNPFFHWRSVNWLNEGVPRMHFGQDLLFSFGAFMSICRIQRNNAEARIQAMFQKGWQPETLAMVTHAATDKANDETSQTNLDELARDQIAQLIEARFKGHELTRLVEAILQTSVYTTYRSPEGPDGGVDILAGADTLGFGSPRLCVQVKSSSTPTDRPEVDKLLGAIKKFNAHHGLFVSWGGFKSNVQKQLASSFFDVRLWSQKELLDQLFAVYDKLDEDIKAELPLKRVWIVAAQDEES
jgi:restriction system protein